MAIASIHLNYIIKCPRQVDPNIINTETFREFIPPTARATQIEGLTLYTHKMPCRWLVALRFLEGSEEDYDNNIKRYELRQQVEIYKPRNTILFKETLGGANNEHFWIFEYQVVCTCGLHKLYRALEATQ